MNDKQMTALLLLLMVAFVFYLYNTNKLSAVWATLSGMGTTGGTASTGNSPSVSPVVPIIPGSNGVPYKALPPLRGVGTPNLDSANYDMIGTGSDLYAWLGNTLNSLPVTMNNGQIAYVQAPTTSETGYQI